MHKFKVGDKLVRVDFTGGFIRDQELSGGRFGTNDEKLQEVMENHPEFNEVFELVKKASPKKEKSTTVKNQEPTINEATTVQQAGNFLRDTFGDKVKAVEVTTKKGIKEVCARLNVEFPNIDFTDI